MVHEKKYYMRFRLEHLGPGGWDCSCCGPAPKDRKAWCRKAKRGIEKVWFDKYIKQELG